MHIGLDYFPAATHAPGVGRYARELARALVELGHGEELRLLELGRAPQVMSEASLGLGPAVRRRRLGLPARLGSAAAHLGLGAEAWLGGVDLFHHVRLHGPPVRRAPQTLAVSDWPAAAAEAAFLRRLEAFDALFVFCEGYRARLVERAGRDPRRVHLVPVGADHWLRDLGRDPGELEPASPPRVLVLGAAQPHRRHAEVLAACERLLAGGRELSLCFAGSRAEDPTRLAQRVADSTLGARVEWCAPREEELPELVARSSLLVHLAGDAGTAVTPLEALLLETPVLVSPLPAFREALGERASYFAGGGAPELADAIEAALARGARPEAGAAEAFSWRANAAATRRAWSAILEA